MKLTSKEKEKFQKELEAILGFVDKLKELNVEGIEPTTAGAETANVMRADEPRTEHSQETATKMLEQAPDRKENFVKVKSILKK